VRRLLTAVALGATLLAGCGGEDEPEPPPRERSDAAALPPSGWKTVRNQAAGFTLAVPGEWSARTKGGTATIRSDDRLVSVSVSADRSSDGQDIPPRDYAREALLSLPGFEGSILPRPRRIRGSRLRTARWDAVASIKATNIGQLVTVVAYQRPGQVTYTLVAFRNSKVRPEFNALRLERLFRSFRAQAPEVGRSG